MKGQPIRAVGVSVPGIAHAEEGTVWAPNIPGWDCYPLRARSQASLSPGVPVAIDSDRACSILGEAAMGAARGCDHAIFLAVGTGIGGRNPDRRQDPPRGERHRRRRSAGWPSIGPIVTEYDECGCFETHASGAGIEKIGPAAAGLRIPTTPVPWAGSSPRGSRPTTSSPPTIKATPCPGGLIDNAIECWGMAVANLVSLFNPQMIVFGGGIFGPACTLPRSDRGRGPTVGPADQHGQGRDPRQHAGSRRLPVRDRDSSHCHWPRRHLETSGLHGLPPLARLRRRLPGDAPLRRHADDAGLGACPRSCAVTDWTAPAPGRCCR